MSAPTSKTSFRFWRPRRSRRRFAPNGSRDSARFKLVQVDQHGFARADPVTGPHVDRHAVAPRHDEVDLRAYADHPEDRPLLQRVAWVHVTVDPGHRLRRDLHDVAGQGRALYRAVDLGDGPFVLDDVLATPVIRFPPREHTPVHRTHVRVAAVPRVVPNKLDRARQRRTVVVHVERTHEYADEELG